MKGAQTLIQGINHLTFSVSNLETSIAFYQQALDATLLVKGRNMAYLDLAGLWLALNEEKNIPRQQNPATYTHIAFTVSEAEIANYRKKFQQLNVHVLKGRTRDPRDKQSIYFTDPDGHLLELHTGTLKDRIDYYKQEKQHMEFFNCADPQ